MDIKSTIKSLLKEADIYKTQGLLAEAKDKYQETLGFVQNNLKPQEGKKIIGAISAKINNLEKEITIVEKKVMSPKMTKESQDLITKMFTAVEGEDKFAAELEGAKTLIKFGQFSRAIIELQKLIKIESIRLDAAKQIMNCYLLESKYDDAVKQYEQWLSSDLLTKKQLDTLRKFVQGAFKNKGIDKTLPEKTEVDAVVEPDMAKFEEVEAAETTATPQQPKEIPGAKAQVKKPEAKPKKLKPITFEKEEEFEEFDVMASIKKSKPDKKK